jgi:hypothetical protein
LQNHCINKSFVILSEQSRFLTEILKDSLARRRKTKKQRNGNDDKLYCI